MYPILTRHGSFFFYSYTAAMALGLLLSLALIHWQTRRQSPIPPAEQANAVGPRPQSTILISILISLLLSRTFFVAANWDYYAANLDETWLLWQGGYSYHGALIGGFAALWALLRRRGLPFAPVGGLLALPMALWSAFGWLACYLHGCAYGRQAFIGPLAADLPDNFGVFAIRYQTQLMGLLLSLLALVILWWARRRLPPRALFWLAVLLLSAARALVNAFRGDPMPLLANIRLDLLLDATLALIASIILIQDLLRPPKSARK